MKAIVVSVHGTPAVVRIEELPSPVPKSGEVLIEVTAIGINYPDLLVIEGKYQNLPPRPFSPGKDVAGIVSAVGPGGAACKPGDRVLALLEYGGYAEEVVALAENCYVLPEDMSFAKAAAMGLAYQTAHFALIERGHYQTGETVLITGAAGGVGLAAVQLASSLGATVLAGVRSPDHAAIVKANGAHYVIDLAVPNLLDSLRDQVRAVTGGRGCDVALDLVGGDVFDASLRALAWRGRLVVIGFVGGRIPEVKVNYLLVKNITITGLQWSDYRERSAGWVRQVQNELFDLFSAGKIDPQVMEEFSMEEFAKALDLMRTGRAHGKLVLKTRATPGE